MNFPKCKRRRKLVEQLIVKTKRYSQFSDFYPHLKISTKQHRLKNLIMLLVQLCLSVSFGLLIWISSNKSKSEDIKEDNIQLLMYKDGVVTKENFVYFSIEDEGYLRLTLYSLDGDADIYVAENSKIPTYEPDRYALHSATFGEDAVDIPESFKRPVVIGIYGNSIYELTSFKLKVERIIHDKFEKNGYSDFVEPYPIQGERKTSKSKTDDRAANKNNIKYKATNKLDIKSLIFSVLEVLASAL